MSGMPQEDSRETKLIERKWRAGYSERGKSGSEGGLCKPTVAIQQGDTCLPYCVAAAQIYNMLMDYHGDVTVKIDGIAASAASVIAMAGTKVLMSPTALMMIHNPLTVAIGDSEEMQKAIDMLSEVKESIINAYAAKSGLSHARIANLMSNETWMNAKKAVELGFADDLLFKADGESAAAEDSFVFSRRAVTNSLMSKVKSHHTPSELAKPAGTPISELEKRLALIKP